MARTLSEFDSKALLRDFGVPSTPEALADDADGAIARAREIGYPVVLKLCADGLAHKTERDLVRLNLASDDAVRAASADILAKRTPADGDAKLLVQGMASGKRELIAGVVRDPQFGACVMLGLGGILTEALGDVTFRLAPLETADALEMMDELQGKKLLESFRGDPPVARDELAAILVGLGKLAAERDDVVSVDVNPLIVVGSLPVAVDALVEVR